MKTVFLGNTGVKVSALGFGTMTFGTEADASISKKLFNRCRDAGINLFDCSDVYGKGKAEEILGHLTSDCRNDVVITTKGFFQTRNDINALGASRRHLFEAVESSLKRLGTDRIDLYFIHRFDEATDLEDTLRALDDLVHQGKIVYIAASNFAAWQIAKGLGISAHHGWSAFKCVQPMYNLLNRQAEVEILPLARSERLAVIPYSPLAAGLLTGKYLDQDSAPAGRFRDNEVYATRYGNPALLESTRRFVDFAKQGGFDPISLAIAWVSAHPVVTAPLLGARSPEQLEPALKSLDIKMTPSLREEIGSLTPTPPPATDRVEERTTVNLGVR